MKHRILAYILCVPLLFSCIYPYEWDGNSLPDDTIVVEGMIVIGGRSYLRISRPAGFEPDAPNSYKAWLEDDSGKQYNPSSQSSYDEHVFYFDTSNVPDGRSYRMHIFGGTKTYYSDWLTPLNPPQITGIQFTPRAQDVVVSVSMLDYGEASGYILLSYQEDWRFHSDYLPEYIYQDRQLKSLVQDLGVEDATTMFNYWCYHSYKAPFKIPVAMQKMDDFFILDHHPVVNFPRSDSRNHQKYRIIVTAATISEHSYRYLKNLDDNGSASGNLFTPNPGEIPSNVSCPSHPESLALGYVHCIKQTSRSAYMDDSFYRPAQSITGLKIISSPEYQEYYENGYRPISDMTLPAGSGGSYVDGVAWGPERCINCVLAGGSLEKPDKWED